MKKRVGQTSQFPKFKACVLYNLGSRRRPKTRRKNKLGKKEKINGDYNLVDRISQLPDEVLVTILSLLSLKEAGATSILSRRWRHVWASTMNLVFDSEFDVNPFRRFYKLEPELKDQERQRYVDWVNRVVVEQHTGTTIERLRVCFDVDCRFTSSIDKWIQVAMNKRVQILELDLYKSRFTKNRFYAFPNELLGLDKVSASNLKHHYPEIPSLRPCGYDIGFKFLQVLCVRKVSVTGEILEYLLSNCPVLERLTVGYANKNLVKLRIVGPLIALKYLVIESCQGLKSIEISDANLVSFCYRGNAINLLLNKVPLLVEVSISESPVEFGSMWSRSIELPFSQLSCCLSQLEILEMEIAGAADIQNHALPVLANLKHLKLIVAPHCCSALHRLTSFMKASPYLQRLVLKVNRPMLGRKAEVMRVPKCPHMYLKVVEIVGYRPHACIIQHVMFLIESIVGLEKVVIDPVRHWCWPRGLDGGKEEPDQEAEARDHAVHHLKEIVPSTVEFVSL